MQNKRIYLFLLILMMTGAPTAQADPVRDTHEQATVLSDEALASYISGRLRLALKDNDAGAEPYCDTSGCAVVVQ